MDTLFTAFDSLYALLATGAFCMIALSHVERRAARIMLAAASVLIVVRWTMWSFTTDSSWGIRAVLGALFGALLLAGLPALWQWSKAGNAAATPSAPAATTPVAAIPSGSGDFDPTKPELPNTHLLGVIRLSDLLAQANQGSNSAPPPSPPATYQQYNYGNKGTIFQGPVTILINPPADPAAMVKTYDFNGIERNTSPSRHEATAGVVGEAFDALLKLGDSGEWQKMLDLSDAQISATGGKWIGAYTFKGIALIHLGKVSEGSQVLRQVKPLIEARDPDQQSQYNEVLTKYLPQH